MRRLVFSIVPCLLMATAHAAERDPLDAGLLVDVGWFFMSTDMRVRVDGETQAAAGDDVDFDDTFGIGDFDRFRADVLWRMADRHALRFMYFENNRDATQSIERDVTFQGETFPAGATVNARSDVTVMQLGYEYAFLRRDTYELAAGIGIHYVDLALGLDATVTAQGTTASRSLNQQATTKAPLPVVGLRGTWSLPHNLYLSAQAQYFYLQFDPYSGSLLDLKVSMVWQMSDHVGIGVAYNDFAFRFDIDDPGDFDGRLRWDYGGAIAFVTFMF